MDVFLNFNESALFFEVFYDSFSRLVSVHSRVFRVIGSNLRVIGKHIYNRQIVAQTHLKVVRVVGGGNLNNACAEIRFNIFVGNNGYLAVNKRKNQRFAHKVLVSFIVRVYRNRRITQKGFGAGCRKLQIAAAVLKRIAQMPEMPGLLLVLNLCVGNRGLTMRTPVDNPLTAVDKSLFVKSYENLFNRFITALVKGETLPFPVAGGAHFLKLFNNSSAVLLFPVPSALQKAVSADVLLGESLFTHFFDDFRLGRYRGVVGAGHPKGIVPLHTLKAD